VWLGSFTDHDINNILHKGIQASKEAQTTKWVDNLIVAADNGNVEAIKEIFRRCKV